MINIDLKKIEIIPLGTETSGEGGSVNADLTNYYTKAEVNTKLQAYSNIGHTHAEYLTEDDLSENFYNKSEIDNLIDNIDIPTGDTSNVDLTDYYTKEELDDIMLSNHISDLATWDNKLIGLNISGNMRNEIPFATINGKSIINSTDNIVIGGSYDDTALVNRISALETELTGVSEQITELNNMVV